MLISVHPTTLELFGLTIHWYGLLVSAGIASGVILAYLRESSMGFPKDTVLDLALVCIPAALLGARLYYVIFALDQFVGRPWWSLFAVWEGGLAIYGGILAGILTGALCARIKKLSFWRLADLAAPSVALGQAIGRWGNFVNQEAYGAAVTNPALHFFPMAVNIDGTWMYATFFYESVWCFLVAAVLLIAHRKRWLDHPGDGIRAYALLYGLERAVVEGLRTDSLYFGPIRISQALSIALILAVTLSWSVRCENRILRAAVPVLVCLMIAAAAAGSTPGMLLASTVVLIAVVLMKLQMRKGRTL